MFPFPRRTIACVLLFACSLGFPPPGPAAEPPIVELAAVIERGDLDAVNRLIAAGVNVNARVPKARLSYTPLFLAVHANRVAVTEALLRAGADPTAQDGNNDPVMVHAANAEHIEQARLLIRHGVSINSPNTGGTTALMRSAVYGKAIDIQAKIDLGADVNLTDPDGDTALHNAAIGGNQEALEVLLRAGAKPDARNHAGHTALHLVTGADGRWSQEKDLSDLVKRLLEAGADINARTPAGLSPLLGALGSYWVAPETVQAVLDAGPDVSPRDEEGRDALLLAARRTNGDAFFLRLLELGGNVKTSDHEGMDLLMIAAVQSDLAMVRRLLDRGLSPSRMSRSGTTAAHFAARASVPENGPDHTVAVMRLLVERGASPTFANGSGRTPLHFAAARGKAALVSWLLPYQKNAHPPDTGGSTPLHHAAASGSLAVLELLLPLSPAVDARDTEGRTPFLDASAADHRDAMTRLLRAGADPDAADKNGVSALAAAIAANDADKARFLLAAGAKATAIPGADAAFRRVVRLYQDHPVKPEDYAFFVGLLADIAPDINARDAEGRTALIWVAASGNADALASVLRRGPDLQARSADGRTALLWAAATGAADAVKTLLDAGADHTLRDASGHTADDWLAWSATTKQAPEPAPDAVPADPLLAQQFRDASAAALRDYLDRGVWRDEDRLAGSTPLHLASALGDTSAITLLLERGAYPDQLLFPENATPLMDAAANGQTNAAALLLEKGADPTLRNAAGDRAIEQALGMRQTETARLFLRRGKFLEPDESSLLSLLVALDDAELLTEFLQAGASRPPASPSDASGENDRASPLRAAAAMEDPAMLKLLSAFPAATGADDPAELVTALHIAAVDGRLANVRYLIEERKTDLNAVSAESMGGGTMMYVSAEYDARPNAVPDFTALSRALENGHHDIVRYLVERGAVITGRTRGSQPPLTFAVEHGQSDMLRYFLDHKAPLALIDYRGGTALHAAARLDNAEAVRLLLDHGAHANAKDGQGLTPLDLAKKENATRVIPLLAPAAK